MFSVPPEVDPPPDALADLEPVELLDELPDELPHEATATASATVQERATNRVNRRVITSSLSSCENDQDRCNEYMGCFVRSSSTEGLR
jgi:hypothetical protein